MELRYGMNPQQVAAHASPATSGGWPLRVVNGRPSFINMLDALNGWQLVRAARLALGKPAAASFKHVSPAGAALAGPVDEITADLFGLGSGAGALASAYVRARDADPRSSFGDFAAVSDPVDSELAELLSGVVCDGIIAPGYEPGTAGLLAAKKSGRFLVMEADQAFEPPAREEREVFGVRLVQDRDAAPLSARLLEQGAGAVLPARSVADLLLGLVTMRYTQSNSVCYLRDGMTIGIGAGQQSRVDCTRLAGAKADTWWLRRHPAVRALPFRPGTRRQERINWQLRFAEGDLTEQETRQLSHVLSAEPDELTSRQRAEWVGLLTGVAFVSDGALPFRDNVDHASRHGVTCIAEPGGTVRSADVEAACREHGITLVRTGVRLFHH